MNEELQINIIDEIGGWGFSFQDMLAQAKGFKGKKIRVPVNSYGGSVLDALAIYNFLKGHSAEVETHIPAFAMSAGTIIAAAGDRVTMAENGFYMIHNPWGVAVGESSDMEHTAEILDKMTAQMVDIYAAKVGRKLGKKEIARMMNEETWMTAHEALAHGFVDELTPGAKFEASFDPKAFKEFNRVPEAVKAMIAPTAPPAPQTSNTMTIVDKIKAFFFGASAATDTQVEELLAQHGNLDTLRASIRTEIETELSAAHAAELNALKSGQAETERQLAASQKLTTDQAAQITALQTEVATLKAAPAGEHTGGNREGEGAQAKKHSEFTERAAAMLNKGKGLPKF